jgi:hypothetical protein
MLSIPREEGKTFGALVDAPCISGEGFIGLPAEKGTAE